MEKIDIRSEIRGDKEDGSWVFHIQVNDQSLIGKEFRFCLVRTVNVLVSRGIDESDTLYETKFPLTSNMHTVEISAKQYPCYSYQGESISISVSAQCEVGDAIIFDSKIDHEIDLPIEHKTKIQSAALDLVGLADSSAKYCRPCDCL